MEILLPHGEIETWERFIYKASRGSCKAGEWLWEGESEFAARKKGVYYQDLSTEDLEQTINEHLLQKLPCNTFNEFLLHLYNLGLGTVTSNNGPFHEYEFYTDLWGHKEVQINHLLHDSALFCFQYWSTTTYWLLRNG